MTETELFESHYKILQSLYPDSLIIIDNFNVLPKDDAFFREFIKNRFQILVTTRCKPTVYNTLEIRELNKEKELCELFYRQCPSSKSEPELVAEIIDLLNAHTLTVSLAALTLEASGMDMEDVRVITLHSNLYNNLSNTYLYLKKMKEAAEALKKHLKFVRNTNIWG